jgi:hypothetical protein
MTFEESLVVKLSFIKEISAKVFPLDAQEGTKAPYITYQLNNNDRTMVHSGFDGLIKGEYQIDIFHNSYKNLKTLTGLVLTEIKTWLFTTMAITGPYISDLKIINQVETYDPETKLYQSTIDIEVYYKEV